MNYKAFKSKVHISTNKMRHKEKKLYALGICKRYCPETESKSAWRLT